MFVALIYILYDSCTPPEQNYLESSFPFHFWHLECVWQVLNF